MEREECSRPLLPKVPHAPTYRMKPVSVVIVSPGTTKCFLLSRPRLSLRGFRATGSLISNAILAPIIRAGAPHAEARFPSLQFPAVAPRGGASEQPPMGTHGLASMLAIGNH